jgi:signal transduction histidine kinase
LSNAFKFTEKGEVKLRICKANQWKTRRDSLDSAQEVVAFAISDTGIGISRDKQNIIFEAFQQAEGSTSRKYGGTGLGLSISRGLAELLGGTIELESQPGKGSVFTLFLPMKADSTSKKEEVRSLLQVDNLSSSDLDRSLVKTSHRRCFPIPLRTPSF